ncbi:MAG: 4'-phosphopantetheinyl transferase superfamily protein [Planctomycetes bacterium]|nr:4'-phosphopantetheinyl transferase superfamily protein [Planctomycetota bacterium]
MDDFALHPTFALASPGEVPLGAREVHVWAVPLHGEPGALAALLSAKERERAARFRFADHQRRYQIGHGALRTILGGYLGVPPTAVEFTQGPRGKPYVAGAGPFFNLSHSGKLALVALAGSEVGIDVEKVRHLESLTAIAQRHFSPTEFAALDALPEAGRQLAFYRCWTRKEAYIKALGLGLAMPLDTFDVSLGERPEFLACRGGGERAADWVLLDVSPGPEFVAAAALRGSVPELRCFRLPLA